MAGVFALIELTRSIQQIADEVARALIRISSRNDVARLSLPLLYPGGSMVGVEMSRLRDGFLVSDAGGARREAGLMGGEKTFVRLAGEVAERFGVRFDRNMIFEGSDYGRFGGRRVCRRECRKERCRTNCNDSREH
jgi:hypothetical protein